MHAMVVDDDPVSRMALVELVSRLSLGTPVECDDGLAAWEQLAHGTVPLLICCDVRMPGLSGVDLLRRIRSTPFLSPARFILVTSDAERETVNAAIELGAAGYILKPFAMKEALPRVEAVVDAALGAFAEEPGATARRLGVPVAKLGTYYRALQRQTAEALDLVAETRATEATVIPALASRIDALHTGCLTLGLWEPARVLESFTSASAAESHDTATLRAVESLLGLQIYRASRTAGRELCESA